MQTYEKLVVDKIISEEEFWEDQEKIKEFENYKKSLEQNLAKSIVSVEMQLSDEEKFKLLKREEKLMQLYQNKVVNGNIN